MTAIAILVVFFVLFALYKNRKEQTGKTTTALSRTSYSIQPSRQMIDEEKQKQREISELFSRNLTTSGVALAEKISYLVSSIDGATAPFTRLATKASFQGEAYLSVDEKRALGLNTRMKYAREFIACFDSAVFAKIEPRSFIANLHLDAFHKVSRRWELQKFKKLGIRQVEILDVGDSRDCSKIKRFRKKHPINSVPDLPLPGCTAPYCRCMYIADVKDF